MIFCTKEQLLQQIIKTDSDDLKQIFTFLKNTDFSVMSQGKYPLLNFSEDEAFFIIAEYTTMDIEQVNPEVHRRYVDIQIMLKGTEQIGVANLHKGKHVLYQPYDRKNDVELYKITDHESFFVMTQSDILIFFPQDIHRPCCTYNQMQQIRKVIIKVNKNFFYVKK